MSTNSLTRLSAFIRRFLSLGAVFTASFMMLGVGLMPVTGATWISFPDFWPFSKSVLQLDPTFHTYQPERRTGVSAINIEQSRVVRYFGFRNVNTTDQRIELSEVRRLGGTPGEVNEIRLIVRNGRIVEKPVVRGTKNPRVDRYLINVVNSWQGSDARFPVIRFTDFVDLVDMVIKLDQGGRVRVVYHNISIRQPADPDLQYKYFNYISRVPVDINYVLPLDGFNIMQVSSTGPAREKFGKLRTTMDRWMNMEPSDVASR